MFGKYVLNKKLNKEFDSRDISSNNDDYLNYLQENRNPICL